VPSGARVHVVDADPLRETVLAAGEGQVSDRLVAGVLGCVLEVEGRVDLAAPFLVAGDGVDGVDLLQLLGAAAGVDEAVTDFDSKGVHSRGR
jgi:hypothetical protein